jgi:PAS domain S-box-containing protein
MNLKTLYAFIFSFFLLLAVIILNRRTFNDMKNYTGSVDHTREVITNLERLSNHFKSAQIYTENYKNLQNSEFYTLYLQHFNQIGSELQNLERLTKDNATQFHQIKKIRLQMEEQLPVLRKFNIAELVAAGDTKRLRQLYEIERDIMQAIRFENNLLVSRKQELQQKSSDTKFLSNILAVVAVCIIVYFFLINFFGQRKQQWLEGFLESILNTSQNAILHYKAVWSHDTIEDFRMDFANPAVETYLGIPYKQIVGKKLSEVLGPGNERLKQEYIDVVETGETKVFEYKFSVNNEDHWFLVSVAPMGEGVTAAFQDITRLKKYEEELMNNIKQLENSNKELEQYAYVASHDLQEPLRKIRSFGSYLYETQADRLDEKGRDQLEKITSSAERMSVLIHDILSFSSMRKDEHYVPTDLNEIVRNVLSDFDLAIVQSNAYIDFDPLPRIEAIPLQMNQLFYNLFNNSFKFSKHDAVPQISILCSKASAEAKRELRLSENVTYYEIIFKDNGIGFSQQYAEQIFGLFKRLNDRKKYPGSGIGLALCRKVVENHKGVIMAKSDEGNGACFYIYMPEKQNWS